MVEHTNISISLVLIFQLGNYPQGQQLSSFPINCINCNWLNTNDICAGQELREGLDELGAIEMNGYWRVVEHEYKTSAVSRLLIN